MATNHTPCIAFTSGKTEMFAYDSLVSIQYSHLVDWGNSADLTVGQLRPIHPFLSALPTPTLLW